MADPDLTDVRVMIPRVRRSLEGPTASASGVSSIDDEQYEALIADAVADIILYSGGLFGHTLEVVERDEAYGAPTRWRTGDVLSEDEVTVIVAQAALNYFFHQFREAKTSEKIADEAGSWEWTKSAAALSEQIRSLREARNNALAILTRLHPALDQYVNLLEARDVVIDRQIEPYTGVVGFHG